KLMERGKFQPVFDKPFFKEFPIKLNKNVGEVNEKLIEEGIIGGYDLSKDYEELENATLIAVTEKRTKAEMDKFVDVLEGIE
ncbi:MAG: glycine dehydrogenase, partial [Tissierellia bacterium]|nr:glycine dehydrogenase [Tissierellia bacterium]